MTGRGLAVILKLKFGKSCDHKKSFITIAYTKPPRKSYPWKPQHGQISHRFGLSKPT
jgi:hypothetical protein